MDISELKQLLKNSTSVLVMEKGHPELVIMDYQAYRGLVQSLGTELVISKTGDNRDTHMRGAGSSQVLTPGDYRATVEKTVGSPAFTPQAGQSREAEILERLNREIMVLKQQIEMEENAETREDARELGDF